MKCFIRLVSLLCAALLTPVSLANENAMSGGQGTVFDITADAFALPVRNISRAHRRDFVIGNSLFNENWVTSPASVKKRQGLGPVFNTTNCSACHFKDGRGRPPLNEKEGLVGLLLRLSVPGAGPHNEPVPVPNYGDQLNHRAILGVPPEGNVKMSYSVVEGRYVDGTPFSLRKPTYSFENLTAGPLPDNLLISPRVAPVVAGLGLLEAISEADILKNADPLDVNKDGISGKPNYVWSVVRKRREMGRFGWKANQPDIAQQNFSAFFGDLGITSQFKPLQNCRPAQKECLTAFQLKIPEIDAKSLQQVDVYVKTLAVPARRNLDNPLVTRGETVFKQSQCASCHVESFRTGVDAEFPENSNQDIAPYTDLLLHDMGPGLADGRPDFEANGSEWRTPPLWGIGLVETVNGHTHFLHDGRARNLEEAILWHGGEAENSLKKVLALSEPDRRALLSFLQSL